MSVRERMGNGRRSPRARRVALTSLGLALALVSSREVTAQPSPPPGAGSRGDLAREAKQHDDAARDHRAAIAGVVRLHYEERKRQIQRADEALQKARRDARDAAIARLSSEASPTPEAILDLATLTGERARDGAATGAADLDKEISLYWRFLEIAPQHREIGRATFSLGRALIDAHRPAEAQGVWRSLVCHDRFPSPISPVPTGAADPYPADCKPIQPGISPDLLSDAWRLLGDVDGAASTAAAEAAYRHALEVAPRASARAAARIRIAALYRGKKRFEASVRALVDLLRDADQEEKRTGEVATDLIPDAYADIAEGLIGLESKADEAVTRVQDAALIPQDARWTREIYRSLLGRYASLGRLRSAIAVGELIVTKWPIARDTTVVESQIADLYDALAARAKEGSPDRAASRESAIAARTKIAGMLGVGWSGLGERIDAGEIQAMEDLVRRSLRRVAVDRTTTAMATVDEALALSDKPHRDAALDRALAEHRLAAKAWTAYLAQDENARDAAETRYWIADAQHAVVVLEVARDLIPSTEELEIAKKSAVRARDDADDATRARSAAFFVVDLADQALEAQYKLFDRTHGAQGLEKRTAVKTTGDEEHRKVVSDPLPPLVLATIAARDEYIARVASKDDAFDSVHRYAFEAGDLYFRHGQFAEARRRLSPIFEQQCGKSEFAYKAWERLTAMATLEQDIEAARKLAQRWIERSCDPAPGDPNPHPAPPWVTRDTQGDAYQAFQKAEKMPDGPERTRQWRLAGDLYKRMLERAPGRDEAPEAVMNGAFAYRQAGAYADAVALYRLFIKEYGDEAALAVLQKGDPRKSPPVAPDAGRYAERVKVLKQAYDTLGAALVLSFDYGAAAEIFAAVARNVHFALPERRDAARNAAILYLNTGARPEAITARDLLLHLEPTAEQRADIDYLFTFADFKAWDERAADEGKNLAARKKAMTAMDRYVAEQEKNPAAQRTVVEAAYHSAKLHQAGHDAAGAVAACKKAVSAFERQRDPTRASMPADLAAECAITVLAAEIQRGFSPTKGLGAAIAYAEKLEAIPAKFSSRAWSIEARARAGEIYDSTWAILKGSSASDDRHRADVVEAERRMIRSYVEAVVWARAWRISSPALERATRRLAAIALAVGDDPIREASRGIIDPETKAPFGYKDGMFLRAWPGMTAPISPMGPAPPLPVVP